MKRAMNAGGTTSLKRYQNVVFTNMSNTLKVAISNPTVRMETAAIPHLPSGPIIPCNQTEISGEKAIITSEAERNGAE